MSAGLSDSELRGLEESVERGFGKSGEAFEGFSASEVKALRGVVERVLGLLDCGALRVAYFEGDAWRVREWVKKAILLAFRLWPSRVVSGGASVGGMASASWYDKVPLKFAGWDEGAWRRSGVRVLPGAVVRYSAYIAPRVILMPCFINVGAYVGEGTMVDSWATVGSCAQIGARCHISGGVGIGGVLEPLQASPVIVEDGCFIGARSEIAEGVVVERGSVVAMGVFLGGSTKIVERASGRVHYGRVPSGSVVVPGSLPGVGGGPSLACAVIVKRVDERTRSRTSLNELLRDV